MLDSFQIILAFLATLVPTAAAFIAYWLNRQSRRAEIQRKIADLYEKTIEFRVAYPQVMRLCRKWSTQSSVADRNWSLYYSYVVLISSFCSTVLYARQLRLLDKDVFSGYYQPLMRLLISVHYPYFSIARKGNYLSVFIKSYMEDRELAGWDWWSKHRVLTEVAPETAR